MIGAFAPRFLLGIVVALSLATGALAHASLVAVDPPDGAVVATPPAEIVLRFSEAVSPLVARLIHPDGRAEIVELQPRGADRLGLELPATLAKGSHVLSWRIVSGDGHPVAGASILSIGAASGSVDASVADRAAQLGLWTTRLLGFVGLGFGVGGMVFAAFLGGPRRVASAALALGALGLAGSVGFQGLDVLGAPSIALTTAPVWAAGLFATTYGWTVALAASAFLLAAFAGSRRPLAVASLALAGAAVAATGHAATAAPPWLMRPAVFLHAVAAIAWIGALPPLGLMLLRPTAGAVRALGRFSQAAPFGIAVLLITGLGLSVVQLGGLAPLTGTAYGQVLCVKTGLVAMVLGLALYNRRRLTRRALATAEAATGRLVRSIAVEVLLLVGVLAIAGLWRFTPPPRVEAATRALAAPAETQLAEGAFALTVAVAPGTSGPVSVRLSDPTRDGQPFAPLELSVELVKPSFGIGPLRRTAASDGGGAYRADRIVLPMGGFWIVTVDALVSDFETIRLRGLVDIRERPPASP